MPQTSQHYVPQFLLRDFAVGRRNKQIFVFDKQTSRSLKTSVRNVAAECGFYNFNLRGVAHSLDPAMQKLEEAASPDIQRIIQHKSIPPIDSDGRATLALFTAVQMLRTKALREQVKAATELIKQAITERGVDPTDIEGWEAQSDESAQCAAVQAIRKFAIEFAAYIELKSWILYSAAERQSFYTSDNPVTMHNTVNQNPLRGTLGLAVQGIEIYFPISASLCLGFLCPSLETLIRQGIERVEKIKIPTISVKSSAVVHSTLDELRAIARGLDGEEPLAFGPQQMMHHNSMQVINAERYVFSDNDDFSLAREMLNSDSTMINGPRFIVA